MGVSVYNALLNARGYYIIEIKRVPTLVHIDPYKITKLDFTGINPFFADELEVELDTIVNLELHKSTNGKEGFAVIKTPLKDIGDMDLFNHPSDVKDLHEIQYSFTITSNEKEDNYYHSVLIGSVEGGAIIISLITKEDVKSVLRWVRNSNIADKDNLYLHCKAGRKITT